MENIKKMKKNKINSQIKSQIKKNMKKKNRTQKNNMKKLRCSPITKKTRKLSFSCFQNDTLNKLKQLWNTKHPDSKINTNVPREIWVQLKDNMQNTCNQESCWLKQKFVAGKLDKEMKDSFAPKAPNEWKKNPNEWLSSVDILKVMKQYEKAYTCFDFIGPSPIDYDTHIMYGECVWEELCHFDLQKQIKSGKTKIGIIFNLDPHYLGGSHWVSLFINMKKKMIFYFDSAGEKIPLQIIKFVNTVKEQGEKLNPQMTFTFDQNYPIEHQYGDTECGVYSLYFIVHMLEDKHNSEYFKTHILKDKYMENFRKIYFNEDL